MTPQAKGYLRIWSWKFQVICILLKIGQAGQASQASQGNTTSDVVPLLSSMTECYLQLEFVSSTQKMLKHYLPCMPNATKSSGDWTHPGSSQLAALTLHSRKRQWIVKLTGTLFHVPTQLVGTQTPMNVLHCSNAAPLPSYQESYKLNYGQGHIFNEILNCETNSSWWISANLTSTVMIM